MKERIYLGKTKDISECPNEMLYLEKHEWDCDWYWGFGYIGNPQLHTHFSNIFLEDNHHKEIKELFSDTKIKQDEGWVLKDLFIQAYALKKCAEIYKYGGHQTDKAFRFEDEEKAKVLNKDCERILKKIWALMERINKKVVV